MKRIYEGKHEFLMTWLNFDRPVKKIPLDLPTEVNNVEVWEVEKIDSENPECVWSPGTLVITFGKKG